jgi:hypothetical protein
MILIGSRALALRAPMALQRKPCDFDWICTQQEYEVWMEKNAAKLNPTKVYPLPEFHKMIVEGSTNCEFEIIQSGNSNELLVDLVEKDPETIETPFGKIPNLDLLFAIKDSHKYKKFHLSANGFWKTAMDWHTMKRLGPSVRPEYQEFSKLRQKETYNYAHPKLNVGKDDFFKDDGISYVFDHDTIHQSVARFEHPAYTYYMEDGAQVNCSKKKFFEIDQSIRLAGVVEEAAVLAIERSLVPHPGTWTPEYAWKFALAKVCSSITSGWFRAFGYEHLPEVLKLAPVGYWNKFRADVEEGLVKPFTGSKY